MLVGEVSVLTRHPVKSMLGEVLDHVEVAERGLVGDRSWAAYTPDGGIGSGKTTRRFRRVDGLLQCRAVLDEQPEPWLVLPPGTGHRAGTAATDEALSGFLGRPVQLRRESDVPHHDEAPVHLLTTGSVAELGRQLGRPVDARRFRANILIETATPPGFVEDDWVGRELAIGDTVVLALGAGMPRCVMVDAPRPDVGPQPPVLKVVAEVHALRLGLQASVRRPGTVRSEDVARLL